MCLVWIVVGHLRVTALALNTRMFFRYLKKVKFILIFYQVVVCTYQYGVNKNSRAKSNLYTILLMTSLQQINFAKRFHSPLRRNKPLNRLISLSEMHKFTEL